MRIPCYLPRFWKKNKQGLFEGLELLNIYLFEMNLTNCISTKNICLNYDLKHITCGKYFLSFPKTDQNLEAGKKARVPTTALAKEKLLENERLVQLVENFTRVSAGKRPVEDLTIGTRCRK